MGFAAVLTLAAGTALILAAMYDRSPLAELTRQLEGRGQFEVIGRDWDAAWSLASLEPSPWGGLKADTLDLDSDVVVLNIWASWCEPCRAEFPAMLELARAYRERGLKMAFVSYDENWEDQRRFFKALFRTMPSGVVLLRDPAARARNDPAGDSLWAKLGATGVPETFFIRQGRVLSKVVGAIDWRRSDIRQYIERLLAPSGS